MGPQGYVGFKSEDGKTEQLEVLSPVIVLPPWSDVKGVRLGLRHCWFFSLVWGAHSIDCVVFAQCMVAFESGEAFVFVSGSGAPSPSVGSQMDCVCTWCGMRYGQHSGVSCPAGAVKDQSKEQRWLQKAENRSSGADPAWQVGIVVEHVSHDFVAVTATSGRSVVVKLKDQSETSNCFMYREREVCVSPCSLCVFRLVSDLCLRVFSLRRWLLPLCPS